jgi:hypothetical protein
MPLIPCPECNKSVSDSAPACPQCGSPLTVEVVEAQKRKESERLETERKLQLGCQLGCGAILFLVFGFVLFAMWSANASRSSSPQHLDTTDEHLRSLPSLRGYTDAEKDEIIQAAKRLDAATEELERRRGS